MQVITLDEKQLYNHARDLAKKIERTLTSPYAALIAVRRGGSYVCDALCEHFSKDRYGERFDITLQRPSTKRKNGYIRRILKKLPYSLLNLLRIGEAWWLNGRNPQEKRGEGKVDVPSGLLEILRREKSPQLLIIDDAIDSGHTLITIVNTLKKINSEVAISVAVMTVTTQQPVQDADYYLYHNGTLIRFPWSNDYKN